MPEAEADRRLHDEPVRWPVHATRDLARGAMPMAVRVDSVSHPDHPEQGTFDRLVVEHPGAVVVLAVDDRDRVACVRQYRHAPGALVWELPAGLCDVPGEEPLGVARRELAEEVGLAAGTWHHVGSAWSSPGFCDERIDYFVAQDLTEVDRGSFVLEHEETGLAPVWIPAADLLTAVLEGAVGNGPLVTATLLAQARGLLTGEPAER